MKKMICCLVIAAGICSGDLYSQTVANKAMVSSSGERLELVRIQNGKSLVHTTLNGNKLYAEFKNGIVTKWSATDRYGGNLTTTTSSKVEGTQKCEVCLSDKKTPYDRHCYEVDCADIPKPPSKRVAQPVNRTNTRY